MQLSARILTALAVLAFTVAVVAGRGATEEVSAATGTIDAMNVGACTTTNGDALKIDDCKNLDYDGDGTVDNADGNTKALFEADELEEAIEVDELYATYAHDPKTAAEAPRGIIVNADLIKISIKDTGRDRRDPVLIGITDASTITADPDTDATGDTPEAVFIDTDTTDTDTTTDALVTIGDDGNVADSGLGAPVVAKALDVEEKELEGLSLEPTIVTGTPITFTQSGSYTVTFARVSPDTSAFKPIAPQGTVKFFGKIGATGTITLTSEHEFKEIGGNVKLDEDVISGEPNVPPAMVLNVSVPAGQDVALQVIYYETSDRESLMGGQTYCTGDDGGGIDSNGDCPGATDANDMANNEPTDVVYTSDEQKKNTPLLVQATSDGNDSDANLYLKETGTFRWCLRGLPALDRCQW